MGISLSGVRLYSVHGSATSSSRRSTKDNTPLDGATTASATSDTINFVSGNPFVEVTKGMNELIFFHEMASQRSPKVTQSAPKGYNTPKKVSGN